ncbi:unnamed protein product [Urochloa decumbens]|uniref:Disease resistance protein At4g27190-like leucine-rich repeats domain-containing protein n=1 Tax=Urochloa decumbens TaxID=240449 RepID=A0ABC9BPL4_9POAL
MIIHIEYLPWQSKRSLQKAIAEELKLPQNVMDFFNQCDDEDDFDGVEQAARGVIPDVKWAILSELGNYKFLVVFHNWSGNYVDLWEYGVPVMGAMNKRVLWTSGGRFRFLAIPLFSQDVKTSAGLSDVVISFFPYTVEGEDAMMDTWRHILHLEAWEVASWYSSVGELDTKIVLECILYKLMIQQDNNINWGTHAANYWVCDGIIHDTNGCGRSTWEIGDALHRTMNLDWHQSTMGFILELLCEEQRAHSDRWVSATGQDIAAVQALTTSFFWTGAIIEGGTLKDLDKSRLRVLHLSHCTFSFSSPPFISCSYLRNQHASSFPDLSSWSILKTVILDGCGELEEIGRNTLPPSLESFSFTSDISTKIKSISFRGCAILKSLMLRGSFGELIELDMSGTSVKTLDLSETQALRLKRLFLLGCEKLRAIHWPQEDGEEIIKLEVLHIDTTRATWSREAESNKQEATSDSRSAISLLAAVHGNDHALANLDVYISVRDARLFRSLIGTTFEYLHIEITSSHKGASQGVNNVASGNSEQEVRAINLQNAAETFWASQLLKAHYIWDWSTSVFSPGHNSFEDLVFLHLDCCPNLVHVLPLYTSNGNGCRRLETLEIVCCGELREVFPSDSKSQLQQKPREFPNLKHIHLYELPMLQRIYSRRMLAPKLKTVKIRGCWSLKRLPAACRAPQRSIELNEEEAHMLPTVDCEKDWWDNLEWDGEEAGHHRSHYKPTHSAYYKKTLLRATVLR